MRRFLHAALNCAASGVAGEAAWEVGSSRRVFRRSDSVIGENATRQADAATLRQPVTLARSVLDVIRLP
ncbi:hypothetical protein [Saccharothrix sp.]|uniref:hypothetical protein n=1 Tax=Saccharothrix sp. TaxID=1873460 RepID=UPI002811B521|nr:hypothetical protein [Saccharothrix sp.]